MTIDVKKTLKNSEIRVRYITHSNRFIDCQRTRRQEIEDLEYGLYDFSKYNNISESKTFKKKEIDFICQEMAAATFLLTINYKEKDSIINKTIKKYNDDFADANITYESKRRMLFEQALEKKVYPKLKNLLADYINALNQDFTRYPNFLTLQVYSEVHTYLRYKYTECCKIFSKHFKAKYIYEYISDRESIWDSNYDYDVDRNEKLSITLAEKATDEAINSIKEQSLTAFFDFKNSDKPPYSQRYKALTGREPQVPKALFNMHKMAAIPAAFPTATSKNSIDESEFM